MVKISQTTHSIKPDITFSGPISLYEQSLVWFQTFFVITGLDPREHPLAFLTFVVWEYEMIFLFLSLVHVQNDILSAASTLISLVIAVVRIVVLVRLQVHKLASAIHLVIECYQFYAAGNGMFSVLVHSNPVITNTDKPNSGLRRILRQEKVSFHF